MRWLTRSASLVENRGVIKGAVFSADVVFRESTHDQASYVSHRGPRGPLRHGPARHRLRWRQRRRCCRGAAAGGRADAITVAFAFAAGAADDDLAVEDARLR